MFTYSFNPSLIYDMWIDAIDDPFSSNDWRNLADADDE